MLKKTAVISASLALIRGMKRETRAGTLDRIRLLRIRLASVGAGSGMEAHASRISFS